ncbi:hypothetical protein ACIG0C_31905 [Kitasatospora aureofaciens]|uniref:Secreted protein n=1 Tax=Kitasatospora aureofaciens TaxID=1894 RepID=A0A1E7N682_KITAU|nr:hypothetical protein [Kitasatospora aureofaciens]QEV01041.1 hypothetical protein CP971_18905 [Streptomyces viridifaciens]ARF79815.1 hypothetical protein B6264_13685 [Kitasatospora aureofaciens]OEV36202.1 hypothetical protein HS99_0030630 [Kitasatospora aureofaciens]UKZ07382.1 hypothetical protein BOQ63_025780 [Streptomyces viridifaciens]GGU86735.1 hypothetical protein GCM10010502_43730 [Kitasatospora aureofaciens]
MVSKKGGAGVAAAVGAVVLLGAGTAQAATTSGQQRAAGPASLAKTDVGQALNGTTTGLGYGVAPIKSLRVDPWANSSADVLNNGATIQPDQGLAPVGTGMLTGPLSAGGGVKDLPLVGGLTGVLPG